MQEGRFARGWSASDVAAALPVESEVRNLFKRQREGGGTGLLQRHQRGSNSKPSEARLKRLDRHVQESRAGQPALRIVRELRDGCEALSATRSAPGQDSLLARDVFRHLTGRDIAATLDRHTFERLVAMNSPSLKFWTTLFVGSSMGFAAYTELHASESAEKKAVKAAREYVESMLTTCGDSSFLNEAGVIRELQGPVKSNGCHETPTPSSSAESRSWSCALRFTGSRERIYNQGSGWSGWGQAPPLLIVVKWSDDLSEAEPGQLTKLACSDLPPKTEPETVTPITAKTEAAKQETPETVKQDPVKTQAPKPETAKQDPVKPPPVKPEPVKQAPAQRGTVNTPGDGFLALRTDPSIRIGSRLAKIPHGTKLDLGECTNDSSGGRWCRTRYGGQSGWVFDRYVVR
jgi:hypothetical protein